MIYLKGISYTSIETTERKARHFKVLNIPFESEKAIEKFRFNREQKNQIIRLILSHYRNKCYI